MPLTVKILIVQALAAYRNLLFVRIILSWLPISPPDWLRPVFNFLYDVTEPFLRLFRRMLPSVNLGGMGLDLSPLLAFLVIAILQGIVQSLLFGGP